jgi:CrcB protein
VDGLVGERAGGGGRFPWGTFVVNISGAALLGAVAGAALTGNALILAGTATLGSYTTLSTWMLESHRLGQDDQLPVALANLLGSLVIGFAAVALGHAVGAAL